MASSNSDLVMIGGYVHTRTGVSLGPYANEMIGRLTVRRAVLSVAGVNEKGYYNSNLLLVETERVMMSAADEVVILADSTKFGHQSLAHLCGLNEIDTLIVDDGISEFWKSTIIATNINVIVSPKFEELADESAA